MTKCISKYFLKKELKALHFLFFDYNFIDEGGRDGRESTK
ncbi:hypothetical protein CSE_01990 [Caldisericum exile AZM16c01]|uniref:Uncharacterized protein n=1 Tax=Caldisericum exile (strain DSM 21853 / NBRC 104410 / AZM16c01) TaxID=511051 RepID=A0A7U6GDC1_CALEA|nr:hypothetical protein CSE_01990 [Caldisericum exile AZM16c01]